MKKPKSGPKPVTEGFYCKGTGHWKRNCRKYLADKKDGKVNKGIFNTDVTDVYLTDARSSAWYFILLRLLIFVTRNRGYGLNEDWLRTR